MSHIDQEKSEKNTHIFLSFFNFVWIYLNLASSLSDKSPKCLPNSVKSVSSEFWCRDDKCHVISETTLLKSRTWVQPSAPSLNTRLNRKRASLAEIWTTKSTSLEWGPLCWDHDWGETFTNRQPKTSKLPNKSSRAWRWWASPTVFPTEISLPDTHQELLTKNVTKNQRKTVAIPARALSRTTRWSRVVNGWRLALMARKVEKLIVVAIALVFTVVEVWEGTATSLIEHQAQAAKA